MPTRPKSFRWIPKTAGRVFRPRPESTAAQDFRSSSRWKRYRTWFRTRYPTCCNPFGIEGHVEPTEDIHHIQRLIDDLDGGLDPLGTAPLCRSCHGKITGMERMGQPTAHLFAAWIAGVDSDMGAG